jgi:hypothetical protein
MPRQETLIEFHFIKNEKEKSVKKMPIHTLEVWAHELTMVVFMFEDPCKKQVVGLICLIEKINNELSHTSANKCFKFKNMKVKTMQDIHDRWDEFFEVFQIEKEKLARDSQRAS